MSATRPDREPVVVLTGFLGSGKIALLNRLLREGPARGHAGASGEVVVGGGAPVAERLRELASAYVYCAVCGDPIRVLGALMRRRDPLEHAYVATTGLADPAPVLRALLDDGEPISGPGQCAAVTVVDALRLSLHLDPIGDGQEQNASADVVLLDLGSLRRAGDQAIEEVLARPGRYREVMDGPRVKEVVTGDGERRRRHAVCHVPAEEARQRQHRAKLLLDLEAELCSDQGGPPRLTSALLASERHGRYLRETTGGKLRIDRAAIAGAERHDGKWVVTSNDDTLAVEDLALAHRRLIRVEACWCALKRSLRSPPVRHLRPWPTETHLMMSLLALLLERASELHAGGAWRELADVLHEIEVVATEPAQAVPGRAALLASSA